MRWRARAAVAALGLLGVGGAVPGHAQVTPEERRQQLLELKRLCDEGVVTPEVCQQRQREILALPAAKPRLSETVPPAAATPGERKGGFLALRIRAIPPDQAASLGVSPGQGVAVIGALPGGPGHAAGIQRGDVLVAYDGTPLESPKVFAGLEARTAAGAQVSLTVRRQGREETIVVTAADRTIFLPARAYDSPLGFRVQLPAGWLVLGPQDVARDLAVFARQVSPEAMALLEREVVGKMEIYVTDTDHLSIRRGKGPIPSNDHESERACQRVSGSAARTAGRPIKFHECGLRSIAGLPAFYMHHDGLTPGLRTVQYWVPRGPGEVLTFAFSAAESVAEARIREFERIMATIRWH
jgi:hypothetical protein